MHDYASRGFESRARPEAPTENHRVTARIVRGEDGELRHEYRLDGRAVGSLNALKAALEAGR
jgi:hypothetical protein